MNRLNNGRFNRENDRENFESNWSRNDRDMNGGQWVSEGGRNEERVNYGPSRRTQNFGRRQDYNDQSIDRDFDIGGSRGMQEIYHGPRDQFSGRGFEQENRNHGYNRPESYFGPEFDRHYNLGTGTQMRQEGRGEFNRTATDFDQRHYGKGPKGWKRSDERIREEACEVLSDNYTVDASGIDLTVKDGCVCLRGCVESREVKREAERCLEHIRGVQDVRNELTVSRSENVKEMKRTGTDNSANLS